MKKSFFGTAAIVSLFFLSCTDVTEEEPWRYSSAICGGKIYDTSFHDCVGGEIIGYCRGVKYYAGDQRCKNDVVETKCGTGTGDSYYNSLNQFCSGSKIYEKCGGILEFNPFTEQCCGSTSFTFSSQFCSDSSVYDKCNGLDYNPSDQRCGPSNVETKCGAGWYNSKNQRCGTDNVIETQCGSDWYNATNTNLRCQSRVVETRCGTGTSYYNPSTQFCSGNSVYSKCGGNTYDPSTQRCGTGSVVETRCGTENNYYNSTMQFCNGNEVLHKCDGSDYNPSREICSNNTIKIGSKCGDRTELFDLDLYECGTEAGETDWIYLKGDVTYSGQNYRAVLIGAQTWMAENLNYDASGSVCYDNKTENCDKYGRLYDWATATKTCPKGWHLPSITEWYTLRTFVSGSATKLKSSSGWNDGNGTDDYGFLRPNQSHS